MTATTEPAGLPPGPLTVADLGEMPDDGHRYELLDGVMVVSPAPGHIHQRAVGRLFICLEHAAPSGLEVLIAPFAVRPEGHLPPQEQLTELQPDVLVARADDFTAKDLPVAPLLAVEVLSPSTRLLDLTLKKAAYEQMGAGSFWVVDPMAPSVLAYGLDADGSYREAGRAVGEEEFVATRPFAVTFRPADLVRRRT